MKANDSGMGHVFFLKMMVASFDTIASIENLILWLTYSVVYYSWSSWLMNAVRLSISFFNKSLVSIVDPSFD